MESLDQTSPQPQAGELSPAATPDLEAVTRQQLSSRNVLPRIMPRGLPPPMVVGQRRRPVPLPQGVVEQPPTVIL